MSPEAQQRALKAALLLSRVVCAHMAEEDFPLSRNGVSLNAQGNRVTYEDTEFGLVDVVGGALMLLRGLVYDLAEIDDLDPLEVARVIALSAAMTDAIGEPEQHQRLTTD